MYARIPYGNDTQALPGTWNGVTPLSHPAGRHGVSVRAALR